MTRTGIVRKIDSLGRIVIPKEMRAILGIKDFDDIEISATESAIIMRKYVPHCIFCGSEEYVTRYKDKLICESCVREISTL